MKQLIAIFAILVFGYAAPAAAQVICNDCRNPQFFPRDFVNAGYNSFYGDHSFLNAEQASSYTMYNLRGQTMTIETRAEYEGVSATVSLGVNLFIVQIGVELFEFVVWPEDLIIQVLATAEDGLVTSRTFNASRHPNGDLPVGRQRTGGGGQGGPGTNSGGPPPGSGGPGPINGGRGGRCGVTDVDGGSHRRTCN